MMIILYHQLKKFLGFWCTYNSKSNFLFKLVESFFFLVINISIKIDEYIKTKLYIKLKLVKMDI